MANLYSHITENKRKTWILMAVYAALVVGVVWAVQTIGSFHPALIIFAAAFSVLMCAISYFHGDTAALRASRAVPLRPSAPKARYLERMIENLAITAGIPKPRIYLIEEDAINAFATGRDPEHASVAVTRGALDRLENEELEGVLAHELSHVKNFDIRVLTLIVMLVGLVSLLADWSRMGLLWGGRRREHGGVLAIAGLFLILLSPIAAQLIKLAVSRKREFLADASGALLTRYPEGLARALEKIGSENLRMKTANHATAHLFLSNPFSARKASALLATHPPLEERVRRLRAM